MQVFRRLWVSVKRNPVINTVLVAIVAQAIVEAMEDGKYDLRTIATYVLQLSLAYVAREFVVPFKEHRKEVREAYMKGLAIPHATPVEGDEVD